MKPILAMLAMLLAFAVSARCQTLSDYQFSTGIDASRWYQLDSTRNLLVVGSEYYRRSYVEEIGFDFPYADTSYSQFSVTLSGDLRLGGTAAITSGNSQGSPFHRLRANINKPKINFFGCTGYASASAYVHRQLFGSAPNRVLVVEYAVQTYNSTSRNTLYRYQVQLGENGDIQVVYGSLDVVNPSGAAARAPNVQRMQGLCVDSTDLWIVDSLHAATHYTNGNSTYVAPGYWPELNRYYRFGFPDDVCASPSHLVAASIDTASVTLSWSDQAFAPEFAVEYSTSVFNPGTGAGTMLTTSDTFAVVGGLQPNTQYYFFVRAVCDAGDTSNAAQLAARTLASAPVSDFPYFCDFEDADERAGWIMPRGTGTVTTLWYADTAANSTPIGGYALYVSQDSGRTNTGGDQWIGIYAYRDVNLAAGDWTVSFDWRAVGESSTSATGNTTYYHFLRAFLVPSSVAFNVQTPASFPVAPHATAVPSGWIDLVPQTHVLLGQSSWTAHQATVAVPVPGCYHLLFYWETDGYAPEVDLPAAIDNISLEMQSCPQPQQLTATAAEDELLLRWRRVGSESLWMVRYDGSETFVQDTFFLAAGLDFNTAYTFEVRSVCGDGDTSLPTTATFSTLNGLPVMQYPYLCDFEDSLECRHWMTRGDGQANRWTVGQAANNTPQGQSAIYVSQDGGATNTYSGSARTTSYAYRELALAAGDYVVSFDWRCLGDGDYHFFRAFIVPPASVPEAGTFPHNSNNYTTVPTGWIDLNPTTHYMSGHSSWTSLVQTVGIADSGLYALLLMWVNDQYSPANPPAAVDNISIDRVGCPIPDSLHANASQTAVDLTWDAADDASSWLVECGDTAFVTFTPSCNIQGLTPNTEYVFSIRTLCYSGDTSLAATVAVRTYCEAIAALPYLCDFSGYALGTGSDDNFIPCWHRLRNHSSFSPQINNNHLTDDVCLYWNLVAGLLDDVYVVLPEMDGSINLTYTELRFKAMKYDFYGLFEDPVLVVGVMDDPEIQATFSPVDTIVVTVDTGYVDYSVPMLSYSGSGHFVAIRAMVGGDNYASTMFLMDDVELHELDVCRAPLAVVAQTGVDSIALSWTPGGDEQSWIVAYADTAVATLVPSYTARNLQAGSEYLFTVASVCSFGDTSQAVAARFRTDTVPVLPPPDTACLVPTGVAYSQAEPVAEHAYEFRFVWSGNAPAYEVAIRNLTEPSEETMTVTDTTLFFDAQGRSGQWTMAVRARCSETSASEWSDAVSFETPVCVGIDESAVVAAVALYPNPAHGCAFVAIGGVDGTVSVSIVDLNGREVMRRDVECNAEVLTLPVEGLAAGSYFVRIAGGRNLGTATPLNEIRKLIVK